MGARKQNLKEMGVALLATIPVDGEEGVSAPIWGTQMNLGNLLGMFLVNGEYKLGSFGKLVVPSDLDFVHVNSPKENHWRISITKGYPYFVGTGFVKLIDTIGGTPFILGIDVADDCRSGAVLIKSWRDWPFELKR